jgi:hypothetical protein
MLEESGQFTRAGFRIRSNRPVCPAAELKRYARNMREHESKN